MMRLLTWSKARCICIVYMRACVCVYVCVIYVMFVIFE